MGNMSVKDECQLVMGNALSLCSTVQDVFVKICTHHVHCLYKTSMSTKVHAECIHFMFIVRFGKHFQNVSRSPKYQLNNNCDADATASAKQDIKISFP